MPVKLVIALLLAAFAPLAEAQVFQTLGTFDSLNGAAPYAAPTLGPDGNYYGTTWGGSSGFGTVFKVTTSGVLTNLVSFNSSNGSFPYGALTLGNDGNFYGTTYQGGSSGYGTAFKVTTNGTLTSLVSFSFSNGANPMAGLTLGSDGNFYGTTESGGTGNAGTVFKLTPAGAVTTLVSFTTSNGSSPYGGLTLGKDGNFYGTTWGGGGGYGTVFKVTTNGALTSLASFSLNNGSFPYAAPAPGTDGNFYGTTWGGGSGNSGTVFRMTPAGAITTLLSFSSPNGTNPKAGLTLGLDGNFYGTTEQAGSGGSGTVFKVTTNGTLTTLVSFNGNNGANPRAALTLGSEGNFYGATETGGNNNYGYGTVFTLQFAPTILVSPQGQTTNLGATVSFAVSASGLNPAYQWRKNGASLANGGRISGATSSRLTIATVADGDAATYSVTVTNLLGGATSGGAALGVIDPPGITRQPAGGRVLVGANVSFNVTVSGTAPFHYQWRFNGGSIANATGSAYALQAVGVANGGSYSVIVTNPAGSVTSTNALLAVIAPPTLSVQFQYGYPLLNLVGMLHSNYVVQYNTNVAGTNWLKLVTLSNLIDSPYPFFDTGAAGITARFYRAYLQ